MLGLGLALAIEALMLLLLFTMGPGRPPGVEEDSATVVTFIAPEAAEKAEEEPSPEPEQEPAERSETQPRPPEQPQPPSPVQPAADPPPQPILPMQWQLPPSTAIRPSPSRPAPPPPSAAYGPADNRPAASRDSEQVGTAPNGEPLYAAEWYREPGEQMLRNYLSTAHGPGWGLIACRTAPDYRVEDCVALEEWPQGAQINRAVLAAAWEFRVRPPRRGGRSLVGAWVRIRIDYELRRR
jgi:protein TonB